MNTRRILPILCALLLLITPMARAEQAQTTIEPEIFFAEETAGASTVLYPVLSGLADEQIQAALNQEMYAQLHIGDLLARLERIRQRSEAEQQEQVIHMRASATLRGDFLSLMVHISGEQHDGTRGERVQCFNYDLSTGESVGMDKLFTDKDAAFAHLNAQVEEQILPELNAYLENGDVLPLPEDSFFLDDLGITFYYPQERFSMLSGSVGACAFYYYELSDDLNTSEPLFAQLFEGITPPADAAQRIKDEVGEGTLTPLPFSLGTPVGDYLSEHPLINDPDFTLSSLLYQFENPQLRGAGLETWMYDEREEDARPVTAIRANRIDFYGLRPGVSTLDACIALLGEPQETMHYDQEDAMDMLLTPGESLLYTFGGNTLEIHADEQGVVSCLIVREGAN